MTDNFDERFVDYFLTNCLIYKISENKENFLSQ